MGEKGTAYLYKQFLWPHATMTENSRHTINPGLLVTPKHAGGIGLAAISVAIKTQRTKHAVPWLIQKPDKYFAAWRRVWAFRGGSEPDATTFTPLQAQLRASPHPIRSLGQELKKELGERLAPMADQQSQLTARSSAHLTALLDRVTSWWEASDLVLSFIDPFPEKLMGYDEMPEEMQQFWATFSWSENS